MLDGDEEETDSVHLSASEVDQGQSNKDLSKVLKKDRVKTLRKKTTNCTTTSTFALTFPSSVSTVGDATSRAALGCLAINDFNETIYVKDDCCVVLGDAWSVALGVALSMDWSVAVDFRFPWRVDRWRLLGRGGAQERSRVDEKRPRLDF